MISALSVVALVVGVALTIRGARIRREERANPGAIAEVRFQFLAEEEPAIRYGLGRALAILEGAETEERDAAEVLGEIARHAFKIGDQRSGMLEAFAAAANHPEHLAAVEVKIWQILEGREA